MKQQQCETCSDGGEVRSLFWNVRNRSLVCRYPRFGAIFRCFVRVYANFSVLSLKPQVSNRNLQFTREGVAVVESVGFLVTL